MCEHLLRWCCTLFQNWERPQTNEALFFPKFVTWETCETSSCRPYEVHWSQCLWFHLSWGGGQGLSKYDGLSPLTGNMNGCASARSLIIIAVFLSRQLLYSAFAQPTLQTLQVCLEKHEIVCWTTMSCGSIVMVHHTAFWRAFWNFVMIQKELYYWMQWTNLENTLDSM